MEQKHNNKPFYIYFILVLSLLVYSPWALGEYNYTQLGTADQDFYTDYGLFASDSFEPDLLGIKTLSSSANYYPLVGDMNNDGNNNIIYTDFYSGIIYLYDSYSLGGTPTKSYSLTHAPYTSDYTYYSLPFLYDIDSDDKLEYIIYDKLSKNLTYLEYNTSDFYLENNFNLGTGGYISTYPYYDVALKCKDSNDCLIVASASNEIDCYSSGGGLFATRFNSTGNMTVMTWKIPSSQEAYCLISTPEFRDYSCFTRNFNDAINYGQFDGDDDIEWVVSNTMADYGGDNVVLKLYVIDYNETNLYQKYYTSKSMSDYETSADPTECAEKYAGNVISNMIIDDLDEIPGNYDEIAIAGRYNPGRVAIYVFKSNLDDKDSHASLETAYSFSNLFKGDFFPDDGDDGYDKDDYCTVLYNNADNESNLLCGSLVNTELLFFDTIDTSPIDIGFSPSKDEKVFSYLVHVGQYETDYEGDTDLDEIITSFGIFRLDLTIFDEMEYLNPIPVFDSAVIPVDFTKKGSNDILLLQNSDSQDFLKYYSDGYVNQPCEIQTGEGEIYIDPSPTLGIWEINTSVLLTFYATDPEGDNINYNATLYYGQDFIQKYNFSGLSSGQSVSVQFKANHTGFNYMLRLEAQDDINKEWDVVSYIFSVGTEGIKSGQGFVFTGSDIIDENDTVTTEITSNEKAEIRNEILGKGLIDDKYSPLIALAIIGLTVIILSITLGKYGIYGESIFYISMFSIVCEWIFFVYIGMLPGWTLLVGILLSILISAFKFRDKISNLGD